MRVVASSEYAAHLSARGGELPLEGRKLFEALKFSYPDIVQELIVGSDGGAPATVIRVADQLRVTQVRVLHVAHKGRRLALLTIEDATEVFCLKAALDTSEYAALVIDARGRVLAFNKPAVWLVRRRGSRRRCGAVAVAVGCAGQRWWEPGTDRQAQDAHRDRSANLSGHEFCDFVGGRGGAHFHRVVSTGRQGRHGRSVCDRARPWSRAL